VPQCHNDTIVGCVILYIGSGKCIVMIKSKSRSNKLVSNFLKWAIYVEFFVFLLFFIVFRILYAQYTKNNSEEEHLSYKAFRDLTCHGEIMVFFIPAFIGLYLELPEKRKKSASNTFIDAYFLTVILLAFFEYLNLITGILNTGYSVIVHVVVPLILLNITAFATKKMVQQRGRP